MQGTAAYIGSKQYLDIPAPEKEAGELQDVFSRCRPLLYRTAYRYLGNPADAEDAVQDGLLSAYKHLDQFKGLAQMSTWEEEYREAELRDRLLQFAEELSPTLRRAFQLRDLDGLTTSEAAQILGVVDGTVKAQVARARAKLTRLVRRALDVHPRSSVLRTSLAGCGR
jgi:DNA-directed RNA polymerase specialized sigma24 family protein